jgi:hypothetical protein
LDRKVIEQRVIVVWVGGRAIRDRIPVYSPEYMLANDVAAERVVFGADVELWQVPMSTYPQMSVGHHELRQRVAPHGAIGAYWWTSCSSSPSALPSGLRATRWGTHPGSGW